MAERTTNGRALAEKICRLAEPERYPDTATCSLIVRHAVSLHRIYEMQCNGHPAAGNPRISPAEAGVLQERHALWCDQRQTVLERRISELVATLPGIEGVRFCGDPRGCAVRLVTANGRGDSWDAPKSICV